MGLVIEKPDKIIKPYYVSYINTHSANNHTAHWAYSTNSTVFYSTPLCEQEINDQVRFWKYPVNK